MSKSPIYIKSEIYKGGIWLIEIIFQKREDARKFFNHLESHITSSKLNKNILRFEDQIKVKIEVDVTSETELQTIKSGVYQFILNIKREDWFRTILSQHFYYDDPEEQQQILDIIYSIMEGNREGVDTFLADLNNSTFLEEAINDIFKGSISLSFDSFVMFRLKPFIDKLERYVEVSIDEYKMEQEYQMFVQTLRDFLRGRKPQMNTLHLVLDDGSRFFNELFYEIKRNEIGKMIDRKLLSNHPVYIDSVTIAPLLSIAPNTIYLYTDDPEQALIRTIKNIFEERVKVLPVSSFIHEKNERREKI